MLEFGMLTVTVIRVLKDRMLLAGNPQENE